MRDLNVLIPGKEAIVIAGPSPECGSPGIWQVPQRRVVCVPLPIRSRHLTHWNPLNCDVASFG